MLLLQQMIVLFILMGIGFLCCKLGIITDEVSKKLSSIVVNIANPALVLTGCMGEGRIEGKQLLLIAVIIGQLLAGLHCLHGILRKFIYIHTETSSYAAIICCEWIVMLFY